MDNTKNILLVSLIIATLVTGTSVTTMQSYAGGQDEHKKAKDLSSIIPNYGSDKKSASQHQDQDNFCYRGDDCEQANQGQQIVGKDNDAKGFNDQSDNLALTSSLTGAGAGTGNGTTPTPNPTPNLTTNSPCLECFVSNLNDTQLTALNNFLAGTDSDNISGYCAVLTLDSEPEIRRALTPVVGQEAVDAIVKCLLILWNQ